MRACEVDVGTLTRVLLELKKQARRARSPEPHQGHRTEMELGEKGTDRRGFTPSLLLWRWEQQPSRQRLIFPREFKGTETGLGPAGGLSGSERSRVMLHLRPRPRATRRHWSVVSGDRFVTQTHC